MAGDKLVRIIQNASKINKEESNLLFGEVVSTSPLQIKVDNRYIVDENFLLLSALVKEMTITIDSHTHNINSSVTEPSLTKIKLWRGLQVGDKVRLLNVNQGQLLYVMEREEGIQ